MTLPATEFRIQNWHNGVKDFFLKKNTQKSYMLSKLSICVLNVLITTVLHVAHRLLTVNM